jgi:hypothetical protein
LIALVGSERLGALLRKEKDEAGPPDCFRRDSSNAFIPVLRSLEAFLLSGFALVSQPKPVPHFFAEPN